MSRLVITIDDVAAGNVSIQTDDKTVTATQISAIQALMGGGSGNAAGSAATTVKPAYTHTAQPSYPNGDQDAWVVPIGRRGLFEFPLGRIGPEPQRWPATINVAAKSGAEPVAAIALVNSKGTVVLNQDAGASGARIVFNVDTDGGGLPRVASGDDYTLRIDVTNDVPDALIQIHSHSA